MIWFFERGTDSLQIETRYNNEASAFEIVWHHSDGSQTLESFADEVQFRKRSEARSFTAESFKARACL
jgi:hypothetical protein